MIQLPDNWMDYVQVIPSQKRLILHMYNSSGQFFTYIYPLDPAFPLQKTLEDMALKLPEEALTEQAYIIENDMSTIKVEPQDQDWGPAPLLGGELSLKQYQTSQQIPGNTQSAPALPPSNAFGPQEV